MYSLILKDILLSKKIIPLAAIYGFFVIFMFRDLNVTSVAVIGNTLAVVYMFLTRSSAYDEINKSEVMLLSLPLKRSSIITAKYLSVLVYVIFGLFSYWLAFMVTKYLGVNSTSWTVTRESLLWLFVATSLMIGIYLPIQFKFGYMKSKIVNMFLFFGAFFAPAYIIGAVKRGKADFILDLVNYIEGLPDTILIISTIFITLFFTAISFFLSIHFYNNREF